MEFEDTHDVIYDADALIRKVEDGLEELKRFRYDSRYRALLGDRLIEKIADWDRRIRDRKNDPFTLVVCGDFKRGKSSLINALLGEQVVTTNVTTETVTLNRISYGNHSNEAILSGGRKMLLNDEELSKERLVAIAKNTGESLTQLNIKRPLPLLRDVTIIDTPGLGDAFEDFSGLVGEALSQADAVLYVFSVSYPLSRQEQMFLKTTVLPQRYTELFLVGNFADTMPGGEDLQRMGELIQKRVDNLLPGQKPDLVSALDESCRLLGEERPNEALGSILEANFSALRRKIASLVADKKEFVLPDRMGRMLEMMKESLGLSLDALEKGLRMDEASMQKTMEQLKEEQEKQIQIQQELKQQIAADVSAMKEEALTWMRELVNRMEHQVDALKEVDANLLTKYYSFYCVDLLQQAAERCVELHQEELYDKLEEISADLATGLLEGQEPKPYRFRFALDNKTWTKGDNVSYVVNQLNFGLLGLVADGFAGSMRQKEVAQKTPQLLEAIHRQYSAVRQSVQKMIEETYDQMALQANRKLCAYYSDKIDDARAEAEECALVARQNQANQQEVETALCELREVLAHMADGGDGRN